MGRVKSVMNNLATFTRTWLGMSWRANAFSGQQAKGWTCMDQGAVGIECDSMCNDGTCGPACDRNRYATGMGSNFADKSYINILFCDRHFNQPSLSKAIEKGKNSGLMYFKYSLLSYWDNRGRVVNK
ncbi:hypothetical protein BCR34DRAFT_592478 [Clohesyomyces aquaticus]|uniref:Glucanase n=1 Tax=Clohesyomyces aquaticus TaxID=1231657 RepID=A0A1Y1YSE8_9PLEO|nr:hypothetical protein BCR34DRAFT_592478 [Clohesyomyces aquaticus]